MDFCRNVSVSGEYLPEKEEFSMQNGAFDDLFPIQNTEGDVSLEWLSAFVEDCLSSKGNCITVPTTNPPPTHQQQQVPKTEKPLDEKPQRTQPSLHLQEFSIPGKARSKRKRSPTTKTQTFTYSDPLLLHQAYWLADSELMVTKEMNTSKDEEKEETREEEKEEERVIGGMLLGNNIMNMNMNMNMNMGQQARRCTHCLSQKTPQWRAGPLGPKTLCNACGVRFKSGRLLPEYRPAKSPTFVSYKHSNSHKKVMEMRMSID